MGYQEEWSTQDQQLYTYYTGITDWYIQDQHRDKKLYTQVVKKKQDGTELGQAQVKLDDIIVIVVEVVVKAMVEVEVQLLFRVGGGWVVG